ncbi:MAG: hypothetical protein KJ964_11475, partial [Verrucomicrobia bacterium]|nr:hypothetical protein [Verrucomicrobiota bacterium]MBU1857546.1 hypothetical protein [Verrucomicrobiota bacterium]
TGASNAERPGQRPEVNGLPSDIRRWAFASLLLFRRLPSSIRCWMFDGLPFEALGRRRVGCSTVAKAMADKSMFASKLRPQPTAYGPQPSSRGIALVMVLGILSVMVLMAVAFAIAMRTERVAAGNYADSVRARQLVHVGLARALDDLAGKLGTNGLMSAVGGTNYPPWDVTNSYTTAYTNTSTNANALKLLALNRENEATNFIPRVLWFAATNTDERSASNHWVLIESVAQWGTNLPTTNLMGRVKYLILNCSGLLDANFVGGATTRGLGTNPMEIAINSMSEMNNYSDFLINRANNYRYETQAELAELNKTVFNGAPSNFTVYSYAPAGYWNGSTNQAQVNLAGDESQLSLRQVAFISAFTNAGFSLYYAGVLFTNLLDYVDLGYKPENYETAVEPVPMISKITYSSTSGAGTPVTYDITVAFTLWYPFVNTGGGTCSFDAQVEVLNSVGATLGTMPLFAEPTITIASGQTNNISRLFSTTTAGPYQIKIISAVVRNGVDDVDKLSACTLPNTVNNGGSKTWECIDPRFNYNPLDTTLWKIPVSADLGAINGATLDYWADPINADCDKDAAMYVANGPLKSAGELGYLAYAPWKTVKLYGNSCQRVLDVFAVGTNASYTDVTNTIWRGRVNPNTRQPEVLSALFANMPVDEYPGQNTNLLTGTDLQLLVEYLQTSALFTNFLDICQGFTNFSTTATNELQKEAFFRNTCGLVSVRQNLFTIIIEAHVASGGNIPRNPVKQRAVALVWRDPYTGEMFVRSIKWLRD